jgi:hypothetical protein
LHREVSADLEFGIAWTGLAPIVTNVGAKYTVYIQRIIVNVRVNAAQTITFQDTAASPKIIALVPSSPGVGPLTFNFGDEGVPLTEGKNLDAVVSGAGLAGDISIKAYARIAEGHAAIAITDL